VHVIDEIMAVIRDLCACSAAFSVVGEHAWAAVLIEQSAELLAHRARLLARLRGSCATDVRTLDDGSSPSGGLEWTN
jgi:hypothetical protein